MLTLIYVQEVFTNFKLYLTYKKLYIMGNYFLDT